MVKTQSMEGGGDDVKVMRSLTCSGFRSFIFVTDIVEVHGSGLWKIQSTSKKDFGLAFQDGALLFIVLCHHSQRTEIHSLAVSLQKIMYFW